MAQCCAILIAANLLHSETTRLPRATGGNKMPTSSKLLIVALVGSISSFAQTTRQTLETSASIVFATPSDAPAVVSVERQLLFCDLTCTVVNYSFCLDETPGCLEGYMEVAQSDFKGSVGASYTQQNDVLTLNAAMISGSPYGFSYYCYAWDSDGNCTDEQGIVAPGCTAPTCPTEVGTIQVTFTKIQLNATLTDNYDSFADGSGTEETLQSINDQFSDEAYGNVIGVLFDQLSGCCVGFLQQVTTLTPTTAAAIKPVSQLLAQTGKVPEKALRRLRVLEARRNAVRGNGHPDVLFP
jgi:hypothetical protein